MSDPTFPKEYTDIFQNHLFQQLMDALDDIVMIIDRDTTVVYVNSAYERSYHRKPSWVIGRKLSSIESVSTTAIKVIHTGKPAYHEVEYLKSVNVDSVGISFPLRYQGEIVGSVSIFNNLTKYLKLANKLHQTTEMDQYLRDQLSDPAIVKRASNFVTINPEMKTLLGLAVKVAQTESTVLIRGESGTGKEIMAKVIHQNSPRKNGPFIKVNCAAIPDTLLESELFGYAGGAFTGAKREGNPGKFELANGGTIFLDEIGDMDFNMQAKLLRVIQEKEVERIGGRKSIPLNVRILAATNQNLEELIQQNKFRQDLYYRLNVIEIPITPLRKRKEDIPILVHYLIKKLSGQDLIVTRPVMDLFLSYDWPGNVRELQNVLEHACIMCHEGIIELGALPQHMREIALKTSPGAGANPEPAPAGESSPEQNLRKMSTSLEREMIIRALRNNKTRTAAIRELGISRSSFYDKIKLYQINLTDYIH
ncbi:sigma-54 interaction domain-containing protein [Clostridium vitabionis]|uniref:sigma-54 interaction domain-containing protein n=1 Tax=Clostridium vitabionis TaxID=2784388 RepID=UPI001F481538|nr:sigma 54-interacting transcriptional regulator [Clostridium vitabionis]